MRTGHAITTQDKDVYVAKETYHDLQEMYVLIWLMQPEDSTSGHELRVEN